MKFASNPILARHMQLSPRPSANTTIGLGVVLFVIGMGYLLWGWAEGNDSQVSLQIWVGVFTAFFAPPIIAELTAMITLRDVQEGRLEMLKLTNLSDEDIVYGYLRATTYRLRLVIALVFGLASGLTVHPIIVVSIPAVLIGTMSMLSWAITAGVNSAFRWQHRYLAAIYAPVVIFIGEIFWYLIVLIMGILSISVVAWIIDSISPPSNMPIVVGIVTGIVVSLVLFALFGILLAIPYYFTWDNPIATRWVRVGR